MRGLVRILACLAVGATASVAQADWHEASSSHFVVYSDESAESLKAYAAMLERYDKAMRVMWGLQDPALGPANRLTVYIVRDVDRVQRLLGRSGSAAGFYVGRAEGSVAIVPRSTGMSDRFGLDPDTVLFHEYAHHLMMLHFPLAFPGWYSEGFAEFNSTATFDRDGSVGLGRAAMHRAESLYRDNPITIEMMLSGDTRRFTPDQRGALYSWGWLLTHYLTFNQERTGQLQAYLAGLNSGQSGLEAAKAAFGDIDNLDRELRRYVRSPSLPYLKIEADRLPVTPIVVRPLSQGEAAVIDYRIHSRRGVTREDARKLVAPMRRAAEPFADDPRVQSALAEAEFDAGNHAEAEAAADRALAVDPRSVDALLYKGRARMALAVAAKSSDAAEWAEIRRLFIAANRIYPNDPEPLLLFFESYRSAGLAPSANAVAALVQAFQLAPHDAGLRALVARYYLSEGKVPQAIAALRPLAYSPHGGARSERMAAIMDMIREKGPEAALAAWKASETGDGAESGEERD